MNLILYRHSELTSDGELKIVGDRAKHISQILKLSEGDMLRVAEIDVGPKRARILSVCPDEVMIQVEGADSSLSNDPDKSSVKLSENVAYGFYDFTLVLALPRPQMLKRVLQLLPVLGVSKLLLTRTARVEKSFFGSKLLQRNSLEGYLRLGMEQATVYQMPEVKVFHKLGECLDNLPTKGEKVLFDKRGMESVADYFSHSIFSCNLSSDVSKDSPLVAIGPEGGILDYEMREMSSLGFKVLTLGDRILRVDDAVIAALAQLRLAFQLRAKYSDFR